MATWSDVTLILPYVVISAAVLLAHRRMLDVLRVGEEEAGTLGIHAARTRLIVVAAATLGTAAAVSVSGLIGFVGIIVAHTVRMTAGASYRIIVPVSMIAGAAFLIGADLIARTVEAPAEVPDRRRHGLHRRAVLPLRPRLPTCRRAACVARGDLMARLGDASSGWRSGAGAAEPARPGTAPWSSLGRGDGALRRPAGDRRGDGVGRARRVGRPHRGERGG